jgi:hypothetical protein
MKEHERRENRGNTYSSREPWRAHTDDDPVWVTGVMGFRLVYDGECRLFVGCVNACKSPVRRFGTFQERGDWKAHGVGFRLTLDKERTWPTK